MGPTYPLQTRLLPLHRTLLPTLHFTYDLAAFFPKIQKVRKESFFAENDLFFWFLRPQIGGGGFLLPRFCPKISKTLKLGLFWGLFATSLLVLQKSAAHQCACLWGIFAIFAIFVGLSGPKIGIGGFLPPQLSPEPSKPLEVSLFWSIFVWSGVVLQNSAAYQCTCL